MFLYIDIMSNRVIAYGSQKAGVTPTGFEFNNGLRYEYNPDQYVTVEMELPAYFESYKYQYIDGSLQYVNEQYRLEDMWKAIRDKRDELLISSDKVSGIMYVDYWESKTQVYKDAWLTYRSALRNIPQTYSTPEEVVWPTVPE